MKCCEKKRLWESKCDVGEENFFITKKLLVNNSYKYFVFALKDGIKLEQSADRSSVYICGIYCVFMVELY